MKFLDYTVLSVDRDVVYVMTESHLGSMMDLR